MDFELQKKDNLKQDRIESEVTTWSCTWRYARVG